ncbi:hypothetical protein GDO78_006523 [Eleutherodactylus coqui]|uniref:Uncharacterized protein n=1 Tax=Eleutherodactylus coqui TaxID=57060 RepID=A0A8J6KGD3_ELECQ|nr:hypothetical protein GDO78_006523 [Eleutherodactylus coqui]
MSDLLHQCHWPIIHNEKNDLAIILFSLSKAYQVEDEDPSFPLHFQLVVCENGKAYCGWSPVVDKVAEGICFFQLPYRMLEISSGRQPAF